MSRGRAFVLIAAGLATACDVGLPRSVDEYQARHGGSQSLVGADAGGDAGAASNVPVCAPKAVPASLPVSWTPPAELHAAACSEQEIEALVPCLLGFGVKPAACAGIVQHAATCAACLVPPAGSPEGPFTSAPFVGVRVNLRACVARVSRDVSPNGCGRKMAAYEACADAACGDCSFETASSCFATVASSVCSGPAKDAMPCSQSQPTQCPPPDQVSDDVVGALIMARLFCTPGSTNPNPPGGGAPP